MLKVIAISILVFLGVTTGTALAADAVASADPSLSDTTKLIFDAVMHSQWWAAAAYGVILAMIGARKLMPASWKEGIKGDIIGTASAFLLAFAGAIGTWGAAAGATMSFAVIATAFKIGIAAIGGYTLVHKVVGWISSWDKVPAWVTPILKMLAMVVGSNAIKKAEAAGAAAVVADPPTGMTGNDKIVEVE